MMRPARGAVLLASLSIVLVPGIACSDGEESGGATTATAAQDAGGARYVALTAALNADLTGGLGRFDDAVRAQDPATAASEMERLAGAYDAFADGLGASEWPPAAAPEIARVRDLAAEAAELAARIGGDMAGEGEALAADVAALRDTALGVRTASAEARAALGLPPPPDADG
jgi:hypothetical protein